jgi:hypothetical protein
LAVSLWFVAEANHWNPPRVHLHAVKLKLMVDLGCLQRRKSFAVKLSPVESNPAHRAPPGIRDSGAGIRPTGRYQDRHGKGSSPGERAWEPLGFSAKGPSTVCPGTVCACWQLWTNLPQFARKPLGSKKPRAFRSERVHNPCTRNTDRARQWRGFRAASKTPERVPFVVSSYGRVLLCQPF